jgi:putative ABC transport system permease protein
VRTLRRKLRRDIGAHRTQFLAVAVTVFLGITLFAASYDSFQNLEASYEKTSATARFANLTVVGGDPESFASTAASQDGVESVETRTVADLALDLSSATSSDTRLLGRVVGVPHDSQVNVLTVQSGRPPAAGEVALEAHLADHFGLSEGSAIGILGVEGWVDYPVSGVVASAEYIWPAKSAQEILTTPDNFGVVFASQGDAAALAGDETPNQAVVYYDSGEPDDALTSTLLAAAPGSVDVFTRAEQPSNAALEDDLAGFEELALFFPILFLTASGIAAWVMITRLIQAQRAQIGILLANGFTRRQVMRHYLGYGLIPGLGGAVPGAVAGSLLGGVITRLYTRLLAIPVTVVETHPATVALAIGLGAGALLLASLGPARSAARISPAESMRGTVPTRGGRPSVAERLFRPLARAPIRWRMGLRGIERNPRRTISTVLGVVLSLVLVLVSWGMIDSIEQLMDHHFGQVERQDARVYFDDPVGESALSALGDVNGVALVEPSFQAPASVSTSEGPISVAVVALLSDTSMHGFYDADGNELDLVDGALVSSGVAESAGVAVGEVVSVSITGLGSVDVPIAGEVDEAVGSWIYLDFGEAERLAGVPVPATAALLSLDAGFDVRQEVLDVPGVAAFDDSRALADTVGSLMTLFYAFVGVMLAFGAAMAFALIFNAMSVNIAERTREVGTLLAVGVDRRSISRLITVENLAVALIGVPVGLVAGYVVSKAALRSFESEMFRLQLDMRPTTLVLSAVAILAVALLSQRPGLAAIRRMDIARIIKDRTS